MYVSERNQCIERDASGAAGYLTRFLAIARIELRPGRRGLICIDQQAAQSFGRLPPPVNPRDHFLTQIATFSITDGAIQLGLKDDVIFTRVHSFARYSVFDACDLKGLLAGSPRTVFFPDTEKSISRL